MSLFWLIGSLVGALGAFAAVPVLIHLINMMRHRRVQWAAMDFLLQSYKRHRNWIWLKQLLLLAMRMAAMVLLAVMLCLAIQSLIQQLQMQLGVQQTALASLLGGRTTHHYVVVDDSFSMSDRVGTMTAFERARRTIAALARLAGHHDNQRFSLLRLSAAAAAAADDQQQAAVADLLDLNAIRVDKDFEELLEERRNQIDVSQLAVGPAPALQLIRQLIRQHEDEQAIVYLISDFRAKEWDNPAEITKALEALKAQGAQIQLINCVRTARPNLAITELAPENETCAAGVPLFINVTVKNYGWQPVKKVQVKIRSLFFDPEEAEAGEPDQLQPHEEQLPTVLLESIGPGQTASSRVQVFFPKAGKHVIEATLQEDAVAADNRRWCVIDFLEGVPVLIVDGSPTQRNGYFLSAAFDPDGRKNTGIRPTIESAAFLRDASLQTLQTYHAIYLADVDVDQLGETAIHNLEQYVRGGGGLAIFLGPHARPRSYNERLYRDGRGLLPLPLGATATLPEAAGSQRPDLLLSSHPVFESIMAQRNPLINLVLVQRYVRPPAGWKAGEQRGVRVMARLRGGDPLVVERRFGRGPVVVFLTTLGPDWNNWNANPTFVVMALKLQAYLTAAERKVVPRIVGAPIELLLPTDKYRKDVTWVLPRAEAQQRVMIDRQAARLQPDSPQMRAVLGGPGAVAGGQTRSSGIYEAWLYTTEGTTEVRRYAVNVDTSESDLTLADSKSMLAKLQQVRPVYLHWDQVRDDPVHVAGFRWGRWVLLILIVLLVCEQVVAYAVSYHPRQGAVR